MKRNYKKILLSLLAVFGLVSLVGCGPKGTPEDTIVVGASPTPHSLILEVAREDIEAQGYKLKIVEFDDYVLPNTSLEAKELDANYFQHLPYLEEFNETRGTNLVSVGAIHFEPLGIYPGKKSTLNSIENGDSIAIPNDATNGGRALLLLHSLGIIELKDTSKGFATTVDDIKDFKGVVIREIEAANISNLLPDIAFGVINGNYALSANIADKALATEATDSLAANTNANVIAVRRGDENSEKTQVLLNALKTQKVIDYINDTFGSSVVPTFEITN